MTAEAMVDELRRSLGNRTDISEERYVRWLNWAQDEVCGFHKKRYYRAKRFHFLEGESIFTVPVLSGTCGASNTSLTFQLTGDLAVDITDYYNGYAVEITEYDEIGAGQETPEGLIGQIRLISNYTNNAGSNIATITEAWDTTPDDHTSFTLHMRKVLITDAIDGHTSDNIFAVERLEQFEDGSPLSQREYDNVIGADQKIFTESLTMYCRHGNYLMFASPPEDSQTLRAYYYRFPTRILYTDLAIECDFPDYWCEVIVLGAIWRGFEKLMEPIRSSEAKKRFSEEVINRKTAFEYEVPHIKKGFGVLK